MWVQGCSRHCPDCFNPESWSFELNQLISIEDLALKILSNPRNTGVTFSGGEPFWQAPGLAKLARQVKAAGLTVMAFTGFTLEKLQAPDAPAGASELLAELDLLIDGSYIIGLWTRSRLKRDESQIKKDNDGSKQKIRHHSQIYYANISHRA